MTERHEKWVRVEPGTVTPAGQPYRVEYGQDAYLAAQEYRPRDAPWTVPENARGWFVDSSWKPPLVLPTEWPVWGFVAFIPKHNINGKRRCIGGLWSFRDDYLISLSAPIAVSTVIAFIPATDEQVARIEAAR